VRVEIKERIPMGHKFALRDIEPGEYVIKYGERIGIATARIEAGEHVHVHNLESIYGRRDLGVSRLRET